MGPTCENIVKITPSTIFSCARKMKTDFAHVDGFFIIQSSINPSVIMSSTSNTKPLLTIADTNRQKLRQAVIASVDLNNFTLVSNINELSNLRHRVHFQCSQKQHHVDCAVCAFVKLTGCPKCKEEDKLVASYGSVDTSDEKWVPFSLDTSYEVSDKGRVRKHKKLLSVRQNGNFTIMRRPMTLARILAIAFKIHGYEKLLDDNTSCNIATWKDPEGSRTPENVIISTRQESAASIQSIALCNLQSKKVKSEVEVAPVVENKDQSHIQA